MLLFNQQKQKIEESRLEKQRAQTLMAEVTADPKLSQSKKVIFAETLREVSFVFKTPCIHIPLGM